jgi:thiamine-monophosphate kinase
MEPGVAEVAEAAGLEAIALAAGGGEDYELLAALPPEAFDAAAKSLAGDGLALTRCGRVVAGSGAAILSETGGQLDLEGFEHLRDHRSPHRRP